MGKHLNAYTHLYNILYNSLFKDNEFLQLNPHLIEKVKEILPKLHRQIFPWAFVSNWKELRDNVKGKGIVLTTGTIIIKNREKTFQIRIPYDTHIKKNT